MNAGSRLRRIERVARAEIVGQHEEMLRMPVTTNEERAERIQEIFHLSDLCRVSGDLNNEIVYRADRIRAIVTFARARRTAQIRVRA